MGMVYCRGCGKEIHESAIACPFCGAQQNLPAKEMGEIPDGVEGWSWGAFLLNGFWAIGNRVWLGMLSFVPFVGFFVAIWLGFEGKRLAWKSKQWESVEHFQHVQNRWSKWGIGIAFTFILISALIFLYEERQQQIAETESAEAMRSMMASHEYQKKAYNDRLEVFRSIGGEYKLTENDRIGSLFLSRELDWTKWGPNAIQEIIIGADISVRTESGLKCEIKWNGVLYGGGDEKVYARLNKYLDTREVQNNFVLNFPDSNSITIESGLAGAGICPDGTSIAGTYKKTSKPE